MSLGHVAKKHVFLSIINKILIDKLSIRSFGYQSTIDKPIVENL
jgi:hypothetical protein